MWTVVGAIVATGVWVYVEVQRNHLLGQLAGTTPGKVTWDGAFIARLLTWGFIPLLSLAAAQYPDVANALYTVVEPFSRASR